MRGIVSCNCVIATDDFNRADATVNGPGVNLGANWEEIAGYGHISNQELLCAASASNTQVKFTVPHPGGAEAAVRVKVKFKFPATALEVQVHVGVQDLDDLLVCTISRDSGTNCGTFGFFKQVAGVNTSLGEIQGIGEPLLPDVWHTVEVCLDPAQPSSSPPVDGVLRAKVTPNGSKAYGNAYTGDDLAGGLYVGLQGEEGCRFDDFRFEWMGNPDGLHGNCPKCTTPCLIEEDDFSEDRPCRWNVISGTWFRNTGDVMRVSGSGGTVLCAMHHPENKTLHYVAVKIGLPTSGNSARVLVNCNADASDYHWAEFSASGTVPNATLTLTLGKGVTTLATAETGFEYSDITATVCWDGSILTANTDVNGDNAFGASAPSTTVADGIWVGLAGQNGGETFDDFRFEKHFDAEDNADATCPNCPAPPGQVQCTDVCIDDEAPTYFLVVLDGFADGSQTGCGSGANANRSYLVEPDTRVTACGACPTSTPDQQYSSCPWYDPTIEDIGFGVAPIEVCASTNCTPLTSGWPFNTNGAVWVGDTCVSLCKSTFAGGPGPGNNLIRATVKFAHVNSADIGCGPSGAYAVQTVTFELDLGSQDPIDCLTINDYLPLVDAGDGRFVDATNARLRLVAM